MGGTGTLKTAEDLELIFCVGLLFRLAVLSCLFFGLLSSFVWLPVHAAAHSLAARQLAVHLYGCSFVWLLACLAARSCDCSFIGSLLAAGSFGCFFFWLLDRLSACLLVRWLLIC